MGRTASQTKLLTLLCWLLVLTAAASAECAWVLWLRKVWTVAPAEPTWLSLQAPTLTYAACESGLAARVKDTVAKQLPQNVEIAASGPRVTKTIHRSDGRSESHIVRYLCLPDTVDPRGPKGK